MRGFGGAKSDNYLKVEPVNGAEVEAKEKNLKSGKTSCKKDEEDKE